MPEHSGHGAGDLLDNIMETFADRTQKKNSVSFYEEDESASSKIKKSLDARIRSMTVWVVETADVLLWRNKKISSGVLASTTSIWVLFEWLSYNFLTLTCIVLVIAMLVQFVWSNASGLLNRSSSEIPRLVLPEELFVNIAVTIGAEINRFLGFLQDVATGRNLKQFLMVVVSLCVAAIIGSWCNFLTLNYIGFVAAHTMPVLYEKYEEQIDSFLFNLLGELQNQYQKLDKGVLSKIPKRNLEAKKLK